MNSIKNSLVVLMAFACTVIVAQDKYDRDKINSLKVAFITESLNLSTEEAQVFWPIYNEHEKNMAALRKKDRTQIHGKIKSVDQMTEKEAEELLKQYVVFEKEEDRLDSAFYVKVGKVLSAKKSLLLMRSKEEFKRRLIKQYRHKKGSAYR